MPLKHPVDVIVALRVGGVDELLRRIDGHPEIKPGDKLKAKRLALVEILILGNTGHRGGPEQVMSAAVQTSEISLEELTLEAKLAAQHIPLDHGVN